jgi:hypothetical protein
MRCKAIVHIQELASADLAVTKVDSVAAESVLAFAHGISSRRPPF